MNSMNSPAPAIGTGLPTLTPVTPAKPKRTRRAGPRGEMPPNVDVTTSADGLTVVVPLQGSCGLGKFAVLDAVVWRRIVNDYGPAFGLNWNGKRTGYTVTRAGRRVASAARQNGANPKATLARLVAAPGLREVVWYTDRNPLHLRLANLEVISRSEFMNRLRAVSTMPLA